MRTLSILRGFSVLAVANQKPRLYWEGGCFWLAFPLFCRNFGKFWDLKAQINIFPVRPSNVGLSDTRFKWICTTNAGNKRQKHKWFHFHPCKGGGLSFFCKTFVMGVFLLRTVLLLGRTPKGSYSSRGRTRHLLETAFSEPLLRTLLRTLSYCKPHSKPPSQNPSENPFSRTLPRTFSEPFLERCVAVRPLRRAPYLFQFLSNSVLGLYGLT